MSACAGRVLSLFLKKKACNIKLNVIYIIGKSSNLQKFSPMKLMQLQLEAKFIIYTIITQSGTSRGAGTSEGQGGQLF